MNRVVLIGKKYWYILIILLLVIGYFVYTNIQKNNEAQAETYIVEKITLQDILALSGEINANEKIDLHFQSGGRLSWVGVKEGDVVKKYQGIASLDQRQLEKTLQKYLNTYSKERTNFDQETEDNDSQLIALSQDLRDRTKRLMSSEQSDLNNAVIDVELQAIAKEYSFLSTPIEGVVTQVDAPSAGMNVSVTDIYQVINPKTMYLSVSADQTEVVKLSKGMTGVIVLDAYPDKTFRGIISEIAFTPSTDETGTVYEVKMALDEEVATAIRLGMTGDVEFILDEIQNVVAVPIEYIDESEEKPFVLKKINNKSVKTIITIGKEYEGLVQVTDGVYEGDELYELP